MEENEDFISKVKNQHDAGIFDISSKNARPKPTNSKFIFFSTCTPDLLMKGIEVDLDMRHDPNSCKNFLIKELKSKKKFEIKKDMDLMIYLAGGIPFLGGTLSDLYNLNSPKVNKCIYGVLTYQFPDKILDQRHHDLFNATDKLHKQLISPICESTEKGYSDMACLLGYLNNDGTKSQKLLKSAAATIRFPPLITCLNKVIDRNNVVSRDVVTICSTFHTYFRYLINSPIEPENIFDYALRCCNIITHIENIPDKLPIRGIDLGKNTKNPFISSMVKLNQPKQFYFWDGDLNFDFEYVELPPFKEPKAIEDANKSFASFTPIAPLSIRVVQGCAIVKGKNHSFLYLHQSTLKGSTDLVNIVDPLTTGKEETYNLEEFARQQGNSKADDVANLIDPDRVKQVIMVCFDRSGSMCTDLNGNFDEDNYDEMISRVIIAVQYLTSFVNKTYGYRVPCILGLLSFNDEIEYRCPLSPLIPDFEDKGLKGIEPDGNTSLWDVICTACDILIQFTRDSNGHSKFKKAKNRIIVISDGEDTSSNLTYVDAAKKLLDSKITLDSVLINKEEICKELAVISHISGGVAINPQTFNEGMNFFELSAFQNIKERKKSFNQIITGNRSTVPYKLNSSQIDDQFIRDAVNCLKFDEEIVNKDDNAAKNNTRLATPRHICSEHWEKMNTTPRIRRIMRELHYASIVMNKDLESYDPDLVIFPDSNNLNKWQVYIKSPIDTPYIGKWFFLLVKFPKKYPIEAPKVKFISVPYNLNISSEGRICMENLEKGYISSIHVIDVLQQIKEVFLLQSIDSPISLEKLDMYKDNQDEYIRLATKSAIEVGKDDYHDFFPKNTKPDDSIVNFQAVFDEKDIVPPYMISQISGRVLKDPVIPPSVGVIYERDELRQLIASSKNPICVVTGLPITETLQQVDQLKSYLNP